MPEWKELHLATDIKQLKEKAMSGLNAMESVKNQNHRDALLKLDKSLNRCYSTYEEHKSLGDQESCYIYLFKAVEILTFLQKVMDDKKYFDGMYGKKIIRALHELEKLDGQLRHRYSEIQNVKNRNDRPNGFHYSNEIVKHKNLLNSDAKETQKIENPSKEEKNPRSSKFINCDQLKDFIQHSNPLNVLIMDVRCEKEFQSKVKCSNIINIPKDIIKPGNSASVLEKVLPEESKSLWNQRGQYENIVLVDNNTNEDRFKTDSPVGLLREILTKWDFPVKYKNHPVVLNGGFASWVDMYPLLTVNLGFHKIFDSIAAKPATVIISDIEYPDSDEESKKQIAVTKVTPIEIVPAPPVNNIVNEPVKQVPSPAVPAFDRSSKPKLDIKNDLDNITTRKPLQPKNDSADKPANITLSEESTKKNFMMNGDGESTNINSQDSNKENTVPVNGEIGSTRENVKIPSEISYVSLKSDSSFNPGSPGLKKSLSSPNISKLDDNMEVLLPKNTPEFDRSNKPRYLASTDSPNHVYQDKHYRLPSQGELEGAVMSAKGVRGLTGLKNLGNTCYMNSILQCIANTPILKDELCRFSPGEQFRNRRSKTEGLIAKEIERVVRVIWNGNVKYYSCNELKTVVGKFRNSFKGSEQQDSHEFFTILMDWLHEDINEPSINGALLGADESTGEKAWGEFRKNNNSIVLDLFYGQQKSTVRCNECKTQSVTFEPFSNLSLLLPSSEDSCSLSDCLELYLKMECISGWNCPKCKTPQNATKKVDITRLPPVLVIHFKRFTSNGWCRKKQTFVNFPVSLFDMKEYSAVGSEQRNEVYNLYAVSNHYGTMESGHYTAYCLNTEVQRWYKFDDQDVSEISQNDVRTSAAYILFYSVKR